MLYFLDSAKPSLIESALKSYPLDGVTTNPTILARDIENGMTLKELLKEIRKLTEKKKLFVQVTSEDTVGMVYEAQIIANALCGDICIKIPSTKNGFQAIKELDSLGISTTATGCYSVSQALLAAKSGADFVAPYISHIDNLSLDGAAVAGEMARQLSFHGFQTQILAASFRTASQVERCIANGVTSVTVTGEMLDILSSHPGTVNEVDSFRKNWNAKFNKSIADLI